MKPIFYSTIFVALLSSVTLQIVPSIAPGMTKNTLKDRFNYNLSSARTKVAEYQRKLSEYAPDIAEWKQWAGAKKDQVHGYFLEKIPALRRWNVEKGYEKPGWWSKDIFQRASYNAFCYRPVSQADLQTILKNKDQRDALWDEAIQRRNISLIKQMAAKDPQLVHSPGTLENAIRSGDAAVVKFLTSQGSFASTGNIEYAKSQLIKTNKELKKFNQTEKNLKKALQIQKSHKSLKSRIAKLKYVIENKKEEVQKRTEIFNMLNKRAI